MARIRSIKPEFPQSESMGRVSRDARLCFIQMWTIADDEGRLRGNSRMLASLLFPYDNDAPGLIDAWMQELENEGCIVRYLADGASYIQIAKWLSHQKIDKPSASKIPPFGESSRTFAKPRESSPLDQGEDQGRDQGRDIPATPAPTPRARKSQKTPLPDDFGINERVRSWAAAKGYGQIDDHLEAFKRKARAKAYSYADWDEAFMEAIREDWAKLRGRAANGAAPPPDARTGQTDAEKTAAYLASQKAPPMSPEQRAATAERLRQAREAIGRVQ
jgi:hypothetical protein